MSSPRPSPSAGWRPWRLAACTARLIADAWRAYWLWRARQATVLILGSLDRRTLKDIGIHPTEFESLVRGGEGHCRRYDARWLWRCDRDHGNRSTG